MRLLRIIFALLAFATAMVIGESYISRLPDHRGFFLVPVADRLRVEPPGRPRHTLVIVVDGLRLDFARSMNSLSALEQRGQCRVTDVGPISVSRPVYAVISTGLEQDRTGSRNNDEQSPLAAESIWDVARESGRSVQGASALEWWRELFPGGFSRYGATLEPLQSFDLTLWHPLEVDSAGHDAGAQSGAYRAAVENADHQLARVLATLDLQQDLVIVTADHGHSDRGGHGGPDPEIREVLTCFAGRGVAHKKDPGAIHSRTIAPALAVLLGLRFPKHMRAGEDDLDQIFEIIDPAAFTPEYLADRRAAVELFRAENARAIAAWLGEPGSWSAFYERERTKQLARGFAFAAAVLIALIAAIRRRELELRGAAFLIAWIVAIAATCVLLHIVLRGTFDWTAINIREHYLRAAFSICAVTGVFGLLVHFAIHRSWSRMANDQLTLAAVALALDLLVPISVGWRLGFPLPGPVWLLYPFAGSIFLATCAILSLLIELTRAVAGVVRSRRFR